jgi:hypothetical protein
MNFLSGKPRGETLQLCTSETRFPSASRVLCADEPTDHGDPVFEELHFNVPIGTSVGASIYGGVVVKVHPGSIAASLGVKRGWHVVSVKDRNDESVVTPKNAHQRLLSAIETGGGFTVRFKTGASGNKATRQRIAERGADPSGECDDALEAPDSDSFRALCIHSADEEDAKKNAGDEDAAAKKIEAEVATQKTAEEESARTKTKEEAATAEAVAAGKTAGESRVATLKEVSTSRFHSFSTLQFPFRWPHARHRLRHTMHEGRALTADGSSVAALVGAKRPASSGEWYHIKPAAPWRAQ